LDILQGIEKKTDIISYNYDKELNILKTLISNDKKLQELIEFYDNYIMDKYEDLTTLFSFKNYELNLMYLQSKIYKYHREIYYTGIKDIEKFVIYYFDNCYNSNINIYDYLNMIYFTIKY
jgi:hypothetical protein